MIEAAAAIEQLVATARRHGVAARPAGLSLTKSEIRALLRAEKFEPPDDFVEVYSRWNGVHLSGPREMHTDGAVSMPIWGEFSLPSLESQIESWRVHEAGRTGPEAPNARFDPANIFPMIDQTWGDLIGPLHFDVSAGLYQWTRGDVWFSKLYPGFTAALILLETLLERQMSIPSESWFEYSTSEAADEFFFNTGRSMFPHCAGWYS